MRSKGNLKQSWDEMAQHYQKKYGKSIMFYEKTIHLSLFGTLKAKRLLDLGCGGGQTSIFFAQQGALVTGVDLSARQLDFARKLAEEEKTKVLFLQGNIEDLSRFEDGSFDLVNSSHTIHYIENLQRCFDEVYRVIKEGGKFVFSVSHPLNHIIEEENNQLIIRHSYFRKGKFTWNWEYPEEKIKYPMSLFVRKVDEYFIALRKSGFVVEDLLEPKTDLDKNSPWYNQSEPHEELIPGALIIGAKKLQKTKP